MNAQERQSGLKSGGAQRCGAGNFGIFSPQKTYLYILLTSGRGRFAYLRFTVPCRLFCFSFRATLYFYLMNALVFVDIDQGIHKGKSKVAQNEKQKKTFR